MSMPTTVRPAAQRGEHGEQGGDPFERRRRSRRSSGTATTGAGVRPPTIEASAPSMPATTTTASAAARSSTWARRRCTPATPTSVRRIGSTPWASEHGGALVGDGQVGGAGAGEHDACRVRGAAGRHTSVVAVRGAAGVGGEGGVGLGVVGPGHEHRARRRRSRSSPTMADHLLGRSCPGRRPPRPGPGAAPGGGRPGRSRGRPRAAGAGAATASSGATSPARTSSSSWRSVALIHERSGWDSNPRTLAGRRFSRPLPSSTRPPLHPRSSHTASVRCPSTERCRSLVDRASLLMRCGRRVHRGFESRPLRRMRRARSRSRHAAGSLALARAFRGDRLSRVHTVVAFWLRKLPLCCANRHIRTRAGPGPRLAAPPASSAAKRRSPLPTAPCW